MMKKRNNLSKNSFVSFKNKERLFMIEVIFLILLILLFNFMCIYSERKTKKEDLVDTLPPLTVTNLQPVSHKSETWSNQDTVTVFWTKAENAKPVISAVSGVAGYSTKWSHKEKDLPDEHITLTNLKSIESPYLPDGKYYFHIRSVDNAGNWDDEAVSLGPFWIDTTLPNISIIIMQEDYEKLHNTYYVTGRLFRVHVEDPIVNGVHSELKYVKLNGVEYWCKGFTSWSKEIYLDVPGWLRVEASDRAGNIAYKADENPAFVVHE